MATTYDVKAIAKLLDTGEFASSQEAAKAVLEEYDKRREGRMGYAVAVNARPLPFLYIGHENREEAKRWASRVGLDIAGLDVWVVPTISKDDVLPRHQKMTEEIEEKKRKAAELPESSKPKRGRRKAA